MFKIGDMVKLKLGTLIITDGFYSPKQAEDFLKNNDYYTVSNILEDGKLGLTIRSSLFPIYFKPDIFEIYKKVSDINAEKPYSELTKLEYAAIKIFAARDWDLSDEYRKNVIRSAKKLLEECNGSD